jgi:undecaprenyl-diphosphatase
VDRTRARELPLREAVVLGLLHGPSELLPISSSAHTALVPWLLGWRYDELDPALRKSFEVALHAGTALGLLTCPPWRAERTVSPCAVEGKKRMAARAFACFFATVAPPRPARKIAVLAAAVGPPATAGYALGERIERRLGTPRTIAAGLFAGAVAIGAGELRGEGSRRAGDARAVDGLALGAAQALALMPGLSRSGMTVAAARARGFRRADCDRLSWRVGLPVIAGATLLKAARQARAGIGAEERRALAAGGGAAFISTCLSARLLPAERRMRVLPLAVAYRVALAGAVWARLRRRGGRRRARAEGYGDDGGGNDREA